MDHIIYTVAGGAARVLEQQAVLSNNMANATTTGFREQLSLYRSVPLQSEQGQPTRVAPVALTPGSNMRPGVLTETGHALHAAIQGDGWFAVQTPDGGEAYTRAGEFAINAQNQLVTQQGQVVLSAEGAPIAVPERGTLSFSVDGGINALGAGDGPATIQRIGQLKLVQPDADTLVRGEDGLFHSADGEPAPADPRVKVLPGFLEKSNVSPAHTMVGLIQNARLFETQMQIIRDVSSLAERANSILSPGG